MSTIKKHLLVLFFIFGNMLFAQQDQTKSIKVNWVNDVDFSINKNTKIKTCLVEGNFVDENLNPFFY